MLIELKRHTEDIQKLLEIELGTNKVKIEEIIVLGFGEIKIKCIVSHSKDIETVYIVYNFVEELYDVERY